MIGFKYQMMAIMTQNLPENFKWMTVVITARRRSLWWIYRSPNYWRIV